MAKTSAKKASSDQTSHPGAKYDGKGLITNWSSKWKEAKEMDMFVQNGLWDNMPPKDIRENYSQFQKFAYRPFYGAVRNCRSKHNKEVHDRANHGETGDAGLKAHMSSEAAQEHYEGQTEEEADEDYNPSDPDATDDNVSCLSFDEKTVSFKSVAPNTTPPRPSSGILKTNGLATSRPNTIAKTGGRTPLGLMYVVVFWRDALLNKRISLQFHLPSGNKDYLKGITGRVSTKQNEYILTQPMSRYMMAPETSLNTHVLSRKQYTQDQTGGMLRMLKTVLNTHPKTIAYRSNIARLVGRDSNKDLYKDDHRVPLPFKVEFAPVSKDVDDLFNGTTIVKYPDETKHLHVELIGVKKDGFSPMKNSNITSDATYKSAKDVDGAAAFHSPIPSNISVNSFGYASAHDLNSRGAVDDASAFDEMNVSHIGTVDDEAMMKQAMKHRENQASAANIVMSEDNESAYTWKVTDQTQSGKIKKLEPVRKRRMTSLEKAVESIEKETTDPLNVAQAQTEASTQAQGQPQATNVAQV